MLKLFSVMNTMHRVQEVMDLYKKKKCLFTQMMGKAHALLALSTNRVYIDAQ